MSNEWFLCVRQFSNLPGSTMGSQNFKMNPLPHMLFISGFSFLMKIPSVIKASKLFLHFLAMLNLNGSSRFLEFSLALLTVLFATAALTDDLLVLLDLDPSSCECSNTCCPRVVCLFLFLIHVIVL